MENQKIALKNFTEEELKEFMKEIGEKPFRGTQIYSWIYKGAKTFDDMKNIPKSLREKLEKVSYIGNSKYINYNHLISSHSSSYMISDWMSHSLFF